MSDRLPPHSIEAEAGILGCTMQDPLRAPDLRLDWFYDLRHQVIAAAILGMAAQGSPIDTITLADHLRKSENLEKVGGLVYLSQLPDLAPSGANFPYWAGSLKEAATLRAVLRTASDYASRVYETPPNEAAALLDEFERAALAIRNDGGTDAEVNIREQMSGVIDEFQACFENQGRLRGLPSGFVDLDRLTSGFREGQLIVIAARPSVGKTSLAMNIAESCAINENIPTAVFSLEMSAKELLFRLACCRARISSQAATLGNLTENDFKKLAMVNAAISKSPLHVIDNGGLTIARLAGMARRIAQRHHVKLVIVDYLQLLRGAEKRLENRVAEITAVSNGLKTLAKELRLPVIACAQLNRQSETDGRKPRLSDLRDSGSIEQDADLVLLLHRNEGDSGNVQAVEGIVAKHRNGPTGVVNFQFFREFTRFENATH